MAVTTIGMMREMIVRWFQKKFQKRKIARSRKKRGARKPQFVSWEGGMPRPRRQDTVWREPTL